MIVYITTQGARLVKEGKHLLVKKNDDIIHTLFPFKLRQIVLMGNISITPPATALILRQGIDTVFLKADGRYLGRFASEEPKNIYLRQRQFLLAGDMEFRIPVARDIVRAKLANMATLLMRIKRTRKASDAGKAAREIADISKRLEGAASLDQIRGHEGAAARAYFSALPLAFNRDLGFRKRVRRPPTDPVNSVLSLLYTFLLNRVYAAVRQAGLDPYPGVLHDLDYGRHALPLDLMEEFRTIIADALTVALFNLGVLRDEDFLRPEPEPVELAPGQEMDPLDAVCNDPLGNMDTPDNFVAENGTESPFDLPQQIMSESPDPPRDARRPVLLTPKAMKRVITTFEKKLQTEFQHPEAGQRLTYAEAMIFQARLYRRVLEGEARHYIPLTLK